MKLSNRLRAGIAGLMLSCATSAAALDTATIAASALSPDCLEYRVVGICYWLRCGFFGCSVRTSVKIRHYVPDAVVSSYANTGENPWVEVRLMSIANPTALSGGDGTTSTRTTSRSSRTPTSLDIRPVRCLAVSPAASAMPAKAPESR